MYKVENDSYYIEGKNKKSDFNERKKHFDIPAGQMKELVQQRHRL
ncbi:hypothetical protein [Planococcus soli]|nr:hypothetical protein [Planococcus soli]